MIAATVLACAVVTQVAPSAADLAPERPYAAEFALGLAAYELGDASTAAAHFAAAGRLAPDAPLWPLYLVLTRGEAPTPPALARLAGWPWQLLSTPPLHAPKFASSGARFTTGANASLLWDATGGALVAALAPFGYEWSFETSGRYLLGARYVHDPSGTLLAELELRSSATGELAGPALPIARAVARGVRATWTATSFEAAPRAEESPWFEVRRFPLDGGTLTVHLPATRETNHLELRADGRRALVMTDSRGIDRQRRRLTWLIDPSDAEPLARQAGRAWGRFSSDGTLVVPDFQDDALWVVDAESGEALTAPRSVAETGEPRSDAIVAHVANDGALHVASRDRVGSWDLRSESWTATLQLVPALDTLDWAARGNLTLSLLERQRVLLFGSHGHLAAYDADRGEQLWTRRAAGWSRNGHAMSLDTERGLVLIEWPTGAVYAIDARTGEVALEPRLGATEVRRVTSFALAPSSARTPGQTGDTIVAPAPRECALVAAADGSLRTFELATGASLGRSSVHAGRAVLGLAVDDARAAREVFSWDAEGRVARLALPGLEERVRRDLVGVASVRAVAGQLGVAVVLHAPLDGEHRAELRRVDDGSSVASFTLDGSPTVALSDDGARVAFVAGDHVLVASTETGATLQELRLAAPPDCAYTGAVAFHGSGHLVLGYVSRINAVNDDGAGVSVVELGVGTVVADHRARVRDVIRSSGPVGDIESIPEHGCFVYSVSNAGLVYMVDDEGFEEIAEHHARQGDAHLELDHVPGSRRLCCSGRALQHTRVFGTRALQVRAEEQVAGLHDLHESPHLGFVLGHRSGRVVVLASADFAPIYERQELTGPGTRLLRGDAITTTRDADTAAWRDVHVTRGGDSHPLASFAAWLDDPLDLAGVTLAHLPTPPRCERGPERHVAATGDSHTLTFDALDPEGALLGVWVLAGGRAPRFHAAAEATPRASFEASVAGPWPVDVELIAVARTGLESKPWRVRITRSR